jgi:Protein of unknown function (DUF1638)
LKETYTRFTETWRKREEVAVLGIITCEILELEFAHLLANDPEIATITVLETPFSHELSKAVEQMRGCTPKSIAYVDEYVRSSQDKLEVIVQVMEAGLHSVIKDLRDGVVRAASEMGPHVDAILLGYGLCGNALKNHEELLSDGGLPIFIPMDEDHAVDDCIGLIIGGRENYYEEQCKVAGTMFINSGFARHWKDIMHKGLGTGKFDLAISKRLMANYERSLLMPTPVLSEQDLASGIEEFNEIYGLRTEVRAGTLDMLQKTWITTKKLVLARTK